MSDTNIQELNGSELGTKEYWDKSYDLEINNYKNHGDVGEVWFDEESQLRIIRWLLKKENLDKNSRLIDLGCGNGMMLVELAREGFTKLFGVDYSQNAVDLATQIAKDQDLEDVVKYQRVDLMSSIEVAALGKFDIIHDKGTYDAISIHPEEPKEKRNNYLKHVLMMMKDESIFIITSCNWTEPELIESFKEYFVLQTVLPTPTFKFGGFTGNVVTSLVFNKKIEY